MSGIAVLPVKRFDLAKQRLAAGIEAARRRVLIEAMLEDVLEAIGEARTVERTIVVSNEPRAVEMAGAVGAEIVPEPEAGGHSEATLAGIGRAREQGATRVVLLPGDCPLLEPREVDRLLTGVPSPYVAIVPDRHGTGTNALLLSPPDVIEPSFGEGSRARHVTAAREAGVPFAVEGLASLAIDLDTPADVVALTLELERSAGRGQRTARALGL